MRSLERGLRFETLTLTTGFGDTFLIELKKMVPKHQQRPGLGTTKSGGADTHVSVVENHSSAFPLGPNTELMYPCKEETKYYLIISCVPSNFHHLV